MHFKPSPKTPSSVPSLDIVSMNEVSSKNKIGKEYIFKLGAYLRSVNCYMYYCNAITSVFRLCGFTISSNCNTHGEKELSLLLNDINLFDLDPYKTNNFYYPHIFSFAPSGDGKKALEIHLKHHPRGDGMSFKDEHNPGKGLKLLELFPGYDIGVYFRATSLRVMYLNSYVNTMICYLESLIDEWEVSQKKILMYTKEKKKTPKLQKIMMLIMGN
jgi:hypothetical protein